MLSFEQNAWDYVHNPYGLLRTPWNVDSTPYLMRHNLTSGSVRACRGTRYCGLSYSSSNDEEFEDISPKCLEGNSVMLAMRLGVSGD